MTDARFAVLSDVHANALALASAIRKVRARGCDRVIVLGDLLTYGVAIAETLELIEELVHGGAVLIAGNHDQFYLPSAGASEAGASEAGARLPVWLRETIEATRAHPATARLAALPFRERYEYGGILFSHANPFAFGDWTYLNDDAALLRAARALHAADFAAGVFGHTHRAGHWSMSDDGAAVVAATSGVLSLTPPSRAGASVSVINPGSIGQPRSRPPAASFAFLDLAGDHAELRFETLDYDVAAQLRSLRESGLSAATVTRLIAFFEPAT